DDLLGLLAARGRLRWCGHLLLRHFLLAGDGTARTLLGPGVRVRALPADRKTAAMANAAIAPDVHQALDVHGDFGAERSLDPKRALDVLPKARHFSVREVPDPGVHTDAGLGEDPPAGGPADTEDVRQRDFDSLVARKVDSCDA